MSHYDLVIIGSGSGNSLITPDFADKRVLVIEGGTFGGTCLNVGCIPTKMFVYAAEVAETVRSSARYGVDAHVDRVRWADIRDRIFGRIDPISAAGLAYRASGPNTEVLTGHARFVGPRRLQVQLADGSLRECTGEQVVIAAGSHPVVPAVITAAGVAYHSSDTVMRVAELPRRVAIVGGGTIACEFAHVFASLGSAVTVLARGPRLLRRLDGDIATRFTEVASRRWQVRLNATVATAGTTADGIELALDDGTVVAADLLLVATGRTPNTADLGLDRAGVAIHPDGRVQVDEYGRTTATGVWALGDVSSPHQLKHVANHEARVVAHNLAHPDRLRRFDHRCVPFAVFSDPQVASVGKTEEELRAAGVSYRVYRQSYGDTAYGWAMEDQSGLCKVLADPDTGLLLGVHLVGYQASVIIQPAVQAMSFGQRADQVASGQYWIHPALSEVLENALLGLNLPDRLG